MILIWNEKVINIKVEYKLIFKIWNIKYYRNQQWIILKIKYNRNKKFKKFYFSDFSYFKILIFLHLK